MKRLSACALVLGGSPITALGICRNLGVNNIPVYCVGESLNEVAFSRYCSKYFLVPKIERDFNVLYSFLDTFAKQIHSKIVLFPASDLFCLALTKIPDLLDEKYLYLSNPSAVKTLVDKKLFAASLANTRIARPETFPLNLDKPLFDVSNFNYPILVKPAVTQNFWLFNVKSFVAHDSLELRKYVELVTKYRVPVVLQEFVPGPPSNLIGVAGYMDRHYNLKGAFSYRRIREWPIDVGCNSMIESIPLSIIKDIKSSLEEYLRSIKYCGLFEAEFKRDSRDGVFKLLEINARAWWQNYFPTVCGVNLVLMAFLDAIGKKIIKTETYKTKIKWLHALNDIFSAFKMFHNHNLTLLDWLVSYSRVRDYSYFNLKDPLPCLTNLLFATPLYARAFFQKLVKSWSINHD